RLEFEAAQTAPTESSDAHQQDDVAGAGFTPSMTGATIASGGTFTNRTWPRLFALPPSDPPEEDLMAQPEAELLARAAAAGSESGIEDPVAGPTGDEQLPAPAANEPENAAVDLPVNYVEDDVEDDVQEDADEDSMDDEAPQFDDPEGGL